MGRASGPLFPLCSRLHRPLSSEPAPRRRRLPCQMLSTAIGKVSLSPRGLDVYVNESSLPKAQRSMHIQSYVRWEMASHLQRLQSDVFYCSECFDWAVGEEWEPHCQSHLAAISSKVCGTVTYCHPLVRPAYCLFHLGNTAIRIRATKIVCARAQSVKLRR